MIKLLVELNVTFRVRFQRQALTHFHTRFILPSVGKLQSLGQAKQLSELLPKLADLTHLFVKFFCKISFADWGLLIS